MIETFTKRQEEVSSKFEWKIEKVIKTLKLRQSMSSADDPYDNASAESIWRRMKAELDMPKGGYKSIKN
jgi:putative transposase